MGKGTLLGVVVAVLAVLAYLKLVRPLYEVPPLPKLEDTWWGPRDASKEDTEIRPFKINVSNEIIKDLHQRLANALPLQEPLEATGQHYGMNAKLLETIITFWQTKYNWEERQQFLNQFPQFTINIQGLKIHYLHVKPVNAEGLKVIPLLLLHGWPGSVREFYEIIPLLTTSQRGMDFVFEVIAPSLPGYGFSEAAVRPGLGSINMTVLIKNFMTTLGYKKFYIQGGDVGAIIGSHLATLFPGLILGFHCNMCTVDTSLANIKLFLGSLYPTSFMSKTSAEKLYPLSKRFQFMLLESGYVHIQATKPDTVGVALRDSPAGLAAYILEKFTTWTNPEWKDLDDGGLTKKYTLTKLLDNIMVYWLSKSITTSIRLYAEHFSTNNREFSIDNIPTEVPTGCARFNNELTHFPTWILRDKYKNLIHISDLEGGHFAAFEAPEVLAGDLYVFTQKAQAFNKRLPTN